jgi:hypothetical protein
VKPEAQVAVHTRPAADVAPQLKAPFAGFGGLPVHCPGGGGELHWPDTLQAPLLQVATGDGENMKPTLQRAVQVPPDAVGRVQLKAPFAGLGGLLVQAAGGGGPPLIWMSAQSAG